jgi:hypothetical protein
MSSINPAFDPIRYGAVQMATLMTTGVQPRCLTLKGNYARTRPMRRRRRKSLPDLRADSIHSLVGPSMDRNG